jgi:tetratricopeptide (TPR) repeat protein
MTHVDRFVDFYDLLSVDTDSNAEAIKQAIKEKRRAWNAKQNHPDPTTRAHAEQTMRDLNDAERTLLRPDSRSGYDRDRPQRLAAAAALIPSQVSNDDWEDRVQYFIDNDNLVAAHRAAVEAVTRAPGSSKAWTLRGQASALLENYRDAEYELAEAGRLSPTEAFPSYLLGETYRMQEKWKSALAQFDKALALEPGNPMVVTSKAAVYLSNDEPTVAVRLMEPVVKQFPDDDVYKFHLALAYHDEAISQLTPVPGTDNHIWTAPEHITVLRRAADKIDKLRCTAPDVREAVTHLRAFANEGEKVTWDLAAPNFYVVIGVLAFLCSCGGVYNTTQSAAGGIFVGLLIGAAISVALLSAFRRKPAWKLAKQALGKGNLTQQMQYSTAKVMRYFS